MRAPRPGLAVFVLVLLISAPGLHAQAPAAEAAAPPEPVLSFEAYEPRSTLVVPLDPIWARCAELGIPVLIHVGEPHAPE